ncbi:hypothetical protein GCM10020001_048200 [Nonomuraea salmonea]
MGEAVVRVDDARPAGAELGLQRDAPDVRGVQGQAYDVADLPVVHPERGGHDQRGEDLALRQPAYGVRLDPRQVAAAMVPGRLGRRAVVLEVDLHPFPVLGEQVEQGVVLGDEHAVGVDEDAGDRAGGQLGEQGLELGVQRGLAAAEHEDVELAVLALEPLVDVGEHVRDRDDAAQVG